MRRISRRTSGAEFRMIEWIVCRRRSSLSLVWKQRITEAFGNRDRSYSRAAHLQLRTPLAVRCMYWKIHIHKKLTFLSIRSQTFCLQPILLLKPILESNFFCHSTRHQQNVVELGRRESKTPESLHVFHSLQHFNCKILEYSDFYNKNIFRNNRYWH